MTQSHYNVALLTSAHCSTSQSVHHHHRCTYDISSTYIQAGDDPHHRGSTSASAMGTTSPVAFLNGNIDVHETDSGGIDKGGIFGGGGEGGSGDGEGEGEAGGGEEGGEELEIAAKGRRREKIVRKVEKAVRKGRVSACLGSSSFGM